MYKAKSSKNRTIWEKEHLQEIICPDDIPRGDSNGDSISTFLSPEIVGITSSKVATHDATLGRKKSTRRASHPLSD